MADDDEDDDESTENIHLFGSATISLLSQWLSSTVQLLCSRTLGEKTSR